MHALVTEFFVCKDLLYYCVSVQEKSGSLIYRHMCIMNHEKTHQTNPMAPWDPLDALLTPWNPLATPQSTPSDQ